MNKTLKSIILAYLICMISSPVFALARQEISSGGSVNVYVAVGRTTEVIFPESIAEIIRSQPKESFSQEVRDKSLFILPNQESTGDLFIRTKNGKSYPINMIFKDPADVQVIINDARQDSSKQSDNQVNSFSVELIKTLIKGDDIPGASKQEMNEEFFSNEYLKMTLKKKYELNNAFALVAELENKLDRSIITPIQHIALSNLKAISSDADMLSASGTVGSKTTIYMVIGK